MQKKESILDSTSKRPNTTVNDRKGSKQETKEYERFNLANKLKNNNYEDLCKSKKPEKDSGSGTERQDFEEKYNDLIKQIKGLDDEFKKLCISDDIREKFSKIEKDKKENPLEMIDSIKGILQMLMKTMKEQEQVSLKNSQGKKEEDYELIVQKAEGEIKRYIRTEHQLRQIVETMQAKIEDYDKDKENFLFNAKNLFKEAKTDNAKLIDMIRQKEAEIVNFNKIIKQKDDIIKSYEERLLSIPILEHKMKYLKDRHAKEKEQVKQYYKQEFANLTKEVQHLHRVLSANLTLDERIKLLEKELYSYKDFNMKKIQALEDQLKMLDEVNEKPEYEEPLILSKIGEEELAEKLSSVVLSSPPTKRQTKPFKTRLLSAKNSAPNHYAKNFEENKTHCMKQRLFKKKADITNELNVLSIARIKDLTHEVTTATQFTHSESSKHFNSYFLHLQNKLDKLREINDVEKEFLRSYNSEYPESIKKEGEINSLLLTTGKTENKNLNKEEASLPYSSKRQSKSNMSLKKPFINIPNVSSR